MSTELIDGLEVEKVSPRRSHAKVTKTLIQLIEPQTPQSMEVLPEADIYAGEDRLTPDVIVAYRDDLDGETDAYPAKAVFLAIEIMSPGQRLSNLFLRGERLIDAGVPWVWLIWPQKQRAWVMTADTLEEAIVSEDLIAVGAGGLSISVRYDDIWEGL